MFSSSQGSLILKEYASKYLLMITGLSWYADGKAKVFIFSLVNIESEVYRMSVLKLSEESTRQMKAFPEEDWPGIVEEAIVERARKLFLLRFFDKAFEHSELTDEDCVRLGRELKKGRFKQLKKMGVV